MVMRGNSNLAVPTFIPLVEATLKYNLSEDVLTRLIQDGTIEAAQLPSGELLVSDDSLNQTKTKEQIIEQKYSHLREQAITISQAVEKYEIPGQTIRGWISRQYISIVDCEYPMTINEAEMAYCADIYHKRRAAGISSRAPIPLLNGSGLPYELKHPQLVEYRRRRKG